MAIPTPPDIWTAPVLVDVDVTVDKNVPVVLTTIPFLTLNGNGKNTVSLDLVEGVNFNPAFYGHADSANYVSLYVRGFLVANGAKQANRAIV